MEGQEGWVQRNPRTRGESSVEFWKREIRGAILDPDTEPVGMPEDIRDQTALELAAQQGNLEQHSMRDWMTGVLNREEILDKAHRLVGLERVHKDHKVALAILDLDDFGKIAKREATETLSRVDIEKQADAVLVKMTRLIMEKKKKEQTKPGGEVWKNFDIGRLGGEEFLLVIDEKDPQKIALVLEEVRKLVEAELATQSGILDVRPTLTASMGVNLVEPGSDVSQGLLKADAALYKAKAQGKNQVMFFDESMTTSEPEKQDNRLEREQIERDSVLKRREELRLQFTEELKALTDNQAYEAWVQKTAEKFDLLEASSRMDSLTKVDHRGAAELALTDMLEHARENNETLRVVAVDIARFKSVNDNLGHPEGDEALKAVAEVMTEASQTIGGGGNEVARWRPGGTFILASTHQEVDAQDEQLALDLKVKLDQVLSKWKVSADVAVVKVDPNKLTGVRELSQALDVELTRVKSERKG